MSGVLEFILVSLVLFASFAIIYLLQSYKELKKQIEPLTRSLEATKAENKSLRFDAQYQYHQLELQVSMLSHAVTNLGFSSSKTDSLYIDQAFLRLDTRVSMLEKLTPIPISYKTQTPPSKKDDVDNLMEDRIC